MPWYVAKIKTKELETARFNLRQQRFKSFYPMMTVVRRGIATPVAMFPGYLFIQFSTRNARWRSINGTRGIVRVLGNDPEKPCPVPKLFMRDIMQARHVENFDKKYKVGDLLRVKEGAFEGHSGSVISVQKSRISILLNILGGSTRVEISPAKVEAIDAT